MAERTPEQRRRGRPRREDRPNVPYHEVERLLVEGEVVLGEGGVETRTWPSQRSIASRFGVAPSLIAAFARQHRCTERRAALQPAHEDAQPAADPPEPSDGAEPRRQSGRPRKAEAPVISYEELDRLLVFGEVVVLDNGTTTTVYPTQRELAERYGVAPSIIAKYAKSRNCGKRRKLAATRLAVRTEEKLVELRSDAIAVGEERLVQMIDDFLLSFEKALKEGRVRADNPTDVNTLARLKTFLLGGADSRQEVRAILSLECLQERYARMLREQRDATPAMAGVIDVDAMDEHAASNTEVDGGFEDGDVDAMAEHAASNTEVDGGFEGGEPRRSFPASSESSPRSQCSFSESRARFSQGQSLVLAPRPAIEDAAQQASEPTELFVEIGELVRVARELAEQNETELQGRLLRAIERVEGQLPQEGEG